MLMGSMLYQSGYLGVKRSENHALLGSREEFEALRGVIVTQSSDIAGNVNGFSEPQFGIDVKIDARS